MGRYMIRRVLLFIPVFFGATFLIFTLVFLIPGDPIRALAGDRQMSQSTPDAPPRSLQPQRAVPHAILAVTSGIVQGDFGTDFRGREVTEIMTSASR